MKRSAPPKRKTPLKRSAPPKQKKPLRNNPNATAKRKRKRAAKAAAYNGIAHPAPFREVDEDYLDFIRGERCVVSGTHGGTGFYRIDPSHTSTVGSGGSDYDSLPLARWLHTELGTLGVKTFARKYNLDWSALIADHNKRYTAATGKEIHRGK